MEKNFRDQYCSSICDQENVHGKSPVVGGQALTGAELFRRQSSGLPVGCAVRQFNQINPYLEKFSIYDSISQFRIRHGMVISEQNVDEPSPAPAPGTAPSSASSEASSQS